MQERERLEGDLDVVERELGRLSRAVAAGGELPALLAAMQEREQRRAEISERLRRADALVRTTGIDEKRVERELLRELESLAGPAR